MSATVSTQAELAARVAASKAALGWHTAPALRGRRREGRRGGGGMSAA
jgi:hypothetical protein